MIIQNAFRFLLISTALLLSGCHQAALDSDSTHSSTDNFSNEWQRSLEPARLAIEEANKSNAGFSKKAVLYYEYGRALGVTCKFSEAEENLKKAYYYDKSSSQPLYLSLVELARLNYDQRKFQAASSYYDDAIKALKKGKIDLAAPLDFADILAEQADSLQQMGQKSEALILTKQVDSIRKKYPDETSGEDRTPYGKHCLESNSTIKN